MDIVPVKSRFGSKCFRDFQETHLKPVTSMGTTEAGASIKIS